MPLIDLLLLPVLCSGNENYDAEAVTPTTEPAVNDRKPESTGPPARPQPSVCLFTLINPPLPSLPIPSSPVCLLTLICSATADCQHSSSSSLFGMHHQCIAPLAANSPHSGLSRAISIASSKVRLCRDRSFFRVAI